MLIRVALATSLLCADPVWAEVIGTTQGPWIPTPLVWRYSGQVAATRYHWSDHCVKHLGVAAASIGLAPSGNLDTLALLSIAGGSDRRWDWDRLLLQARYLLMDELKCDAFSVSALGIAYLGSKSAVQTAAEFVPASANFEIGLSVGREYSRSFYWMLRGWLSGYAGIANVGSPWLRGDIGVACQPVCGWQLWLRADAVQTSGACRYVAGAFPGYARLRAGWLDLGVGLEISRIWGQCKLGYWQRLYEDGAPRQQTGALALVFTRSF